MPGKLRPPRPAAQAPGDLCAPGAALRNNPPVDERAATRRSREGMKCGRTNQQQLDALNAAYDAAKETPSIVIRSARLAVAKVELEAFLWELRKDVEVKENGNG